MNSNRKKIDKERILIVGCGNVGRYLLPRLLERFQVYALTHQKCNVIPLRNLHVCPILGDLDYPKSLSRLSGLASTVIYLAPPPKKGLQDRRIRNFIRVLAHGIRLIYVSTSGVYGDCAGQWVDESRPINPQSARAKRRVDAEQVLRSWAVRSHGHVAIIRVPGIYAQNRLPIERLQNHIPALLPKDDVYTNHIHQEDLAQVIFWTIFRSRTNRIYHASDDSNLLMGEYFDVVAQALDLQAPPRLNRLDIQHEVSSLMLSFMSESRRLKNQRMKNELGVRLCYPTVQAFFKTAFRTAAE